MTRTNPYVGPKAFQRDDEYLFCGRDYEVQKLLNLLIAEQILLLHAPSGAGKTSLINKAVIPQLEEKKFLVLPVMRVSRLLPDEILKQLDVKNRYVFSALLALEKFREDSSKAYQLTPDELAKLQKLAKMTFFDYVKGVSEELKLKRIEARNAAAEADKSAPEKPKPKPIPSKIALIFDQFEEILSVDPTDYKVKEEFFKQVGDALFTDEYWAMFSMREDNAASLGALVRQLPTRLETRFRLELLNREKAEEAIKKPAESQKVPFEKEAVDQLIEDLCKVKAQSLAGQTEEKQGDFVEPMQLQVVCYRLWEKLKLSDNETKKEITTEDLKGTHVNEALAEFYDNCLREVSQTGSKTEEDIRQWIEDELITPGETRGMVFMDQKSGIAAGMPKKIVEGLQTSHLLRGEYRAGAHWYELTHDRFIGPIKQSNRPWSALKIATRRAAGAHRFAVLWFVGIALLWLFAEFFVTGPVRESRMFAETNKFLDKDRTVLWVRGYVIRSVLAATQTTDQKVIEIARTNINKVRKAVVYESIAARKSRPGKKAAEDLEALDTLQRALDESVGINETIAKIKQGSQNQWKNFNFTDDDVRVLKSLVAAYDERGRNNNSSVNSERPPTRPSPTLVVLSAARPVLDPLILKRDVQRVEQVQRNKDWTSFELNVTAFDNAAKDRLDDIRRTIEALKTANEQRLGRINAWSLRNRRDFDIQTARLSLAKLESKSDVEAAFRQPRQEIIEPTDIRTRLTELWDRTIPAEQATTVMYSNWCVVLTAFLIYLARAAVDLEERVGQFLEALSRVKSVSDPLGWDIKKQTPSILVMLALAGLLSIHIRVSWICFYVVRSIEGANWWGLLFVPGIIPVLAIAYYVIEHYRDGQIARARILEIMSTWNAFNLSLRAFTKR